MHATNTPSAPSASQAAFLLKKFLAENQVDIKLGLAQEAVARTKGFNSWNVLSSKEDPRGRAPIAPAVDATHPLAVRNELWIVCGQGVDEAGSSTESIWASSREIAREVFTSSMRDIAGDEEIEVTSMTLVGRMMPNGFELDAGQCLQPTGCLFKHTTCAECGCDLDHDGYCTELACPYSEWDQEVPLSAIEERDAAILAKQYGSMRRQAEDAGRTARG